MLLTPLLLALLPSVSAPPGAPVSAPPGAPVSAPPGAPVSAPPGALVSAPPGALPVHLERADQEADLAALRAEFVEAVGELVAFAQKKKLYLHRDQLHATILVIDPDNAKSRRALGYKRGKDGGWEQGKYREPSDRGKAGDVEELARLRAATAEEYGLRLTTLLAEASSELRREEARTYFVLDDQCASLNLMLGRVRDASGRWRDPDELQAELREAEVAAALEEAKALRANYEPWTVGSPVDAKTTGLEWTVGFKTDRLRVTGTGEEDEIRRAIEAAYFVDELLRRVIPAPPLHTYDPETRLTLQRARGSTHHGRFTVYLLTRRRQIPQLLSAFPNLTAAQKELHEQTTSGYLNEFNSIGVWVPNIDERLDAMVRQFVAAYLRDEFQITARNGWVFEGFGIYLTHLAVGTRMTFFVRPGNYVEDTTVRLDDRLQGQDADWLAELTALDRARQRPKLSFLLGKDVNGMDTRDMLLANALARYLFEVQPEHLQRILQRIGQGEASVIALQEELGVMLPELEETLYAWAATGGK